MQIAELAAAEDGRRTHALVLSTGDEVMAALEQAARELGISGASFTGIGAFETVTLGYFDWTTKDYRDIPINDQVEIVSMVGNIAHTADGGIKVHAHVVVATAAADAKGGHLRHGIVRPTLELVIEESPQYLVRREDETTGLALLDLTQATPG